MFSFLPQIDEKYRRKEKPKLIIRIKDSPYEKNLKNDKQFLNKMVVSWLKKTGDHYDVVKQAFKDAFEIHVIATSYPVKTDILNSQINNDEMNIYDSNFSKLNPSFINACETIYSQSLGTKTCGLMKDKKQLENFVQTLISNPNIDFTKLDLYHNIVANSLLEYSTNHILQEPYTDQSICFKMDGSMTAYNIYQERIRMINELEHHTMNVKFKDVPPEMKHQQLDSYFLRIIGYGEAARIKNVQMAEDIVLPHWTYFRKKFDGTDLEKMIQGFIEIFADREKEFLKKLEKIDDTVRTKYIDLLEKEKIDLEKKQHLITSQNVKQMYLIDSRIYNIRWIKM